MILITPAFVSIVTGMIFDDNAPIYEIHEILFQPKLDANADENNITDAIEYEYADLM